jgi:hypothetical protein
MAPQTLVFMEGSPVREGAISLPAAVPIKAINQLLAMPSTGWRLEIVERGLKGDLGSLFQPLLRQKALGTGARYGLVAAEEFCVVRFASRKTRARPCSPAT